MKAIILDGNLKSALAAVRSLGQKGVNVVCGADRKTAMSLFSRYSTKTFIYTSPLINQYKFIDEIIEIAKKFPEKPLIYAFSDEAFLPLAQAREKIEPFAKMIIPVQESIKVAFDKSLTLRLAEKKEIPIPKTYFVDNIEEIKKISSQITYPAVIKPRYSCSWHKEIGQRAAVVFVNFPQDLEEKYSQLYEKTEELPLVQEFIKGQEYGVEFLYFEGEAKAICAHRRIRSLYPTGGASVVKETIAAPPLMEKYSRLLLDALKWEGVAMVEFKVDERDNTPKLMEINGRFWGSLPLAIFAGADFPYLMYQLANGEEIAPNFKYRTGIKSRHFLGDLNNLLSVFFKRDEMRPHLYPERLNALKNFLKPVGFYDVFSISDTKPFFMEILDSFNKLIRK